MYGAIILFGIAGFFSARSIENKYGRRAWGLPHWAWGLITAFSLLIGAILQYIALRELKKQAVPQQALPVVGQQFTWPAQQHPLPQLQHVVAPVATATAVVPAQVAVVPAQPPAGWHPDPSGRHQHRWWDGAAWTQHVASNGVAAVD